ncbi:MAG: hypothetical protein K0S07_1056 [Chlamydiales bacterium]|jgi:hypothetical protein|nr:hypothetical protein [Chlamydiales bacterium]
MNEMNSAMSQLPPELWAQVLTFMPRQERHKLCSLSRRCKQNFEPFLICEEREQLQLFVEHLKSFFSYSQEQLKPLSEISFTTMNSLKADLEAIEQAVRPLLQDKSEEKLVAFSLELLQHSRLDRSYGHVPLLATFDSYRTQLASIEKSEWPLAAWMGRKDVLHKKLAKRLFSKGFIGESIALAEFAPYLYKNIFILKRFAEAEKEANLSLMIRLVSYVSQDKKEDLSARCLICMEKLGAEDEKEIWLAKLELAKVESAQHRLFKEKPPAANSCIESFRQTAFELFSESFFLEMDSD